MLDLSARAIESYRSCDKYCARFRGSYEIQRGLGLDGGSHLRAARRRGHELGPDRVRDVPSEDGVDLAHCFDIE